MIIDEEHRFGVAHKERMKQLRASVDALALTATPIPRTLYMALSGVRDMSVIETPPLDRLPIETMVRRFSKAVIKEALERELERGGQVFFVHNRVQSLLSMTRFIQELVPDARVIMGHGQMNERELEATMVRFVSGQADVLVSTAIVESGLDIPTSNTIIINRADRFGLAQLYQLRGRVGRERLQGYCYLLVPADGRVDDQAQRRLRALQELTELGSGFKLALRDLEIRGAGNLLGAQQHGHIAAVGYDLYSKLLAEAVQELKGDRTGVVVEPVISVQVEGFLPEEYVPEVNQRLAFYKRLAGAAGDEELADLRAELADRFGPLPEPAEQLLDIVRIRVAARAIGVERVEAGEGKAVITFAPSTPIEPARLVGRHPGQPRSAPDASRVHAGGGDRDAARGPPCATRCSASWAASPFDDPPAPGSLRGRAAAVRLRQHVQRAQLGAAGRQEAAQAAASGAAAAGVGPGRRADGDRQARRRADAALRAERRRGLRPGHRRRQQRRDHAGRAAGIRHVPQGRGPPAAAGLRRRRGAAGLAEPADRASGCRSRKPSAKRSSSRTPR